MFLLSVLPGSKVVSGGKMILDRCKYCFDSKDPRHAHFYISIPQNNDELSFFYCHKCHTGGIVTHRTLLHWGVYRDDIAMDLIGHNKKAFSNPINRGNIDRAVYNLNNYFISNSDVTASKLAYINNRLGLSLNYNDILGKKIVLNLRDLLGSNHITSLTRNIKVIEEFDRYFVGFISMDNAFVTLRRIVDKGVVYSGIDKRYQNYNIFDKKDNTERHYVIPTNIDLSVPRKVQIHIAEGHFDILSIYYNLRKDPNQIYVSIGGSEYLGIIKYFLYVLKLIYVDIHVYPDNDKFGSRDMMMEIKEFLRPYSTISLFIHRNLFPNEKDFGVPLNKIDERIEKIL